jgi:hypothetical protein
MSHGLGMLIESLVAVLLMLTIGYCIALNRRLKRLRTDERVLRDMIAELVGATDTAERAIAGLKITVAESDRTLGERLRTAERLSATLDTQIGRAEKACTDHGGANRHDPAGPRLNADAVAAAATAFAERVRLRTTRRAA